MYSGFFFFSSRRRHTRWTGDWSSDVCSSDLRGAGADRAVGPDRASGIGAPHRCGNAHAREPARVGEASGCVPALWGAGGRSRGRQWTDLLAGWSGGGPALFEGRAEGSPGWLSLAGRLPGLGLAILEGVVDDESSQELRGKRSSALPEQGQVVGELRAYVPA